MRRNDRQITDPQQIHAFIAAEQILRIAFIDGEEAYIVPVNYGYVCECGKSFFYFHGAQEGRKYQLSLSAPQVGFEIDGKYHSLPHTQACKFSATFQSVIGTGQVQIVTNEDEKKKGLDAIMAQVSGRSDWTYSQQAMEKVAVFRLEVKTMSCKGRLID